MDWNDEKNALKNKLGASEKQKIWAIGGGKGGVGKSLVTANISICLSLMGYRTIVIDLDLGGANLHTCLGVPIPTNTLSDYLLKKVSSLQDLVTQTPIHNLSLISGAQDAVGMANLKNMQKSKILTSVRQLDADFVLLDLGAGTTFNTLDFFISADQGILVSLPEPTSIENTYRFIKSVLHRKLKLSEELIEINPIIDEVMNSKMNDNIAPVELIQKVSQKNPQMARILQREIEGLVPNLIINQARTQTDLDIGHSMKIISKKYFGLNLNYAGHLEYDATVWQSVKKRRPLLMEFPNSPLIGNFDKIIHKLLNI